MKKTNFYYQTVIALAPAVVQLFAKELKAAYVAEKQAKLSDDAPGENRFNLEIDIGNITAFLAGNIVDQAEEAGNDLDYKLSKE